METVIFVVVSAVLIIFNLFRVIKNYKEQKQFWNFFKKSLLNFILIFLGIYNILMVYGQLNSLKVLLFVLGFLFLVKGVMDVSSEFKTYRKTGWFLVSFASSIFPIIGIIFGLLLIFITLQDVLIFFKSIV